MRKNKYYKENNKKIGVSVIVACYKRIKQTLKTLNLIFNSEGWGKKYLGEVIVADSTKDDSLKKALFQKFKQRKKEDEFFYLKPRKIGISVNKNVGAKKARFPILIFCDSDIEVEKDTILRTIKALKKHKKAAAISGNVIWKGGKRDRKVDRPRKEDRMIKIKNTIFVEAIYSRYIATYKEIFWDVGGYDEEVFTMRGEGSDLSIRYWRAGYPLVYDPSWNAYHITNAPDSIALRLKHPEWGIAKDFLLLGYKYGIFETDCKNFAKTVEINFSGLNDIGYYRILEGIGKYLDFIIKSKRKIDNQKEKMKSGYDFKFLEVFSNKKEFLRCIKKAEGKLNKVRKKSFI